MADTELYSYVVEQMNTANFAPCRVALREAGGGTLGDYLSSRDFVDYCVTKIPHVEWTPQVSLLVESLTAVVEQQLDIHTMRAMATSSVIPTSAIYWGACHIAWKQLDRYVR